MGILVNLNHFRLLRVVGRGAFGKVRIVERKDTNLSFALKYIRKDEGTEHIILVMQHAVKIDIGSWMPLLQPDVPADGRFKPS